MLDPVDEHAVVLDVVRDVLYVVNLVQVGFGVGLGFVDTFIALRVGLGRALAALVTGVAIFGQITVGNGLPEAQRWFVVIFKEAFRRIVVTLQF